MKNFLTTLKARKDALMISIACFMSTMLCTQPVFAANIQDTLVEAIKSGITFVLTIGGWLGVLMFIICAVMMIISTDDKDKQRWKKGMMWVLVATVLMFMANPIFNFLKTTFGVGSISDTVNGLNIFT